MYITALYDKAKRRIHLWVSAEMPRIPDDEEDDVIAVFDTDKPVPSERTVITKAGVIEAQGGMPHFGDDAISEEVDLSQDEFFGTKLKCVFQREY